MNSFSFEDFKTAVTYSYEAMSWVTWLVLFILVYRTVQSFNKAYANHKTYADMKANNDTASLIQFYVGITLSLLCVVVFFLPYLINYNH